MALASIALILSANGKRVLVVDWDLEKPSLAKYLIPFLPPQALENSDGVIDIVWTYASAIRHAPPNDIQELQLAYAHASSPIECAIPDELNLRKGGQMHILSAGREPGRDLRVRYFSWEEFFDSLDGDALLVKLWKVLKKQYDHILIDCPRISNASKFPILSADVLVSCFSMDSESMDAGAKVARWATERLAHRPHFICPLTLRSMRGVEWELTSELLDIRDDLFRDLASFPEDALLRSTLEVPETPYYSNQRVLPPLFESSAVNSITWVLRQLAGAFANQPELEWRLPENHDMTKYSSIYRAAKDRYSQVLPFMPPYSGDKAYAFVSYAREDRDQVTPVLQELLNVGWRVWWDEEIPGGSEWQSYLRSRIEKASHVLVFLSAHSVQSKWVTDELLLAESLGKAFLSVRLDWREIPNQLLPVLGRYQMLNKDAIDFRERLGRGMQLLQEDPSAT
jgi:hypothetical protein